MNDPERLGGVISIADVDLAVDFDQTEFGWEATIPAFPELSIEPGATAEAALKNARAAVLRELLKLGYPVNRQQIRAATRTAVAIREKTKREVVAVRRQHSRSPLFRPTSVLAEVAQESARRRQIARRTKALIAEHGTLAAAIGTRLRTGTKP